MITQMRRSVWLLGIGMLCMIYDATIAAQENSRCIPTDSDQLGPFYVSDMPVLSNINRFGKAGEPLVVSGTVRSAAADGRPIAGARIEVWQTDGAGSYYPEANGRRATYRDEELDMRGTLVSEADGQYLFRTVIPGRYSRARHFHYRIVATGYRTLVTQHYVREGGSIPGGICRSAAISRENDEAHFRAPDIYLVPRLIGGRGEKP